MPKLRDLNSNQMLLGRLGYADSAGLAMSEEEGISKKAFSELMEVTPGRVSQYLADGLIGGDALVGSGRSARIRPAIAREQLRARLDVGHRARATAKAQLDPIL